MIRFLTDEDVLAVADLDALSRDMKAGLRGQPWMSADVPPRQLIWAADDPIAVFGIMSAFSRQHDLFITKSATLVGSGQERGVAPSVHCMVTAFRASTGAPIAVLAANALTKLKCAAITAVVTDACASPDAGTLALIGAGVQARGQVLAVASVRALKRIRVFSRTRAAVETLIRDVSSDVDSSIQWQLASSAEEAVQEADIVSTATTSHRPLFSGVGLVPHVHINCVGAHTTQSREVPRDVLQGSTVIVEDVPTAISEAGEVHRDAIDIRRLGDLDATSLQSRRTVFSSTGHAFLDLLTTAYVLRMQCPENAQT